MKSGGGHGSAAALLLAMLPSVAGGSEMRRYAVGATSFSVPERLLASYEPGPPGRTSLTLRVALDGEFDVGPRHPQTPAAAWLIIGLNDVPRDLLRAVGPHASAEHFTAAGLTLVRTAGEFRYFAGDPALRAAPDGRPIAYRCHRVRTERNEGEICRTWYTLTNVLSVEYIFDETHLQRWPDLDRAVRHFVEDSQITRQ